MSAMEFSYCNYCKAVNPADSVYCCKCGKTVKRPEVSPLQKHPLLSPVLNTQAHQERRQVLESGEISRPDTGQVPSLSSSFNGIGTSLYGKRDFLPDGSFITTKWLILLWIPLIPLSSYRVIPSGALEPALFGESQIYFVLSKGKPNLKQVTFVYSFLGLLIALGPLIALISQEDKLSEPVFMVLFVLIGLVPWALRIPARAKAAGLGAKDQLLVEARILIPMMLSLAGIALGISLIVIGLVTNFVVSISGLVIAIFSVVLYRHKSSQ